MFSKINVTAPDVLYAVAEACAADTRSDKIDLSVGVYRDTQGQSPVMDAVKAAEEQILREQRTKVYRPLLGDPDFCRFMTELVLGADNPLIAEGRIVAIQSTGGTGALRLAAALAKSASSGARIHLGVPSWPSHAGVFGSAGLEVVEHRYWLPGSDAPSWPEIYDAACASRADDLFLLHGPCHNPTGIDLEPDQRATVLAELDKTGAAPMLDVAYYGLGDGLDADLALVRTAVASARRCIVALSCSKAFGLYRDRTGVLLVACADRGEAQRVAGRLGSLSRMLVSTAPAHGAEVVAQILGDETSKAAWRGELEGMRRRILNLRRRLAASGVEAFSQMERQKGIFAMLPVTPEQVASLAARHAIYMPPSGRANLVGLRDVDIERFAAALRETCAAEPALG
jgi:aspartate/tyrosine/aromatic aminotransferase